MYNSACLQRLRQEIFDDASSVVALWHAMRNDAANTAVTAAATVVEAQRDRFAMLLK